MTLEFYDPRRPVDDLVADVRRCMLSTALPLGAEHVDNVDQVVRVFVPSLPYLQEEYDEDHRAGADETWAVYLAFIAEVAEKVKPLLAAQAYWGALATLNERRDRKPGFLFEDLWVGPELAAAVADLRLDVTTVRPFAGGVLLSITETAMRSGAPSRLDDAEWEVWSAETEADDTRIGDALAAATADWDLPPLKVWPKVEMPDFSDLPDYPVVLLWRRGSTAAELWTEIGLQMAALGAEAETALEWWDVPVVDGLEARLGDAGEVELELGTDELPEEEVVRWLAELVDAVGATLGFLDRHKIGWVTTMEYDAAPRVLVVAGPGPDGLAEALAGASRETVRGVTVWGTDAINPLIRYDQGQVAMRLLRGWM